MFTCKNILVVIDPNSLNQIALKRACALAKLTQSKIVALTCLYDKTYDMTAVLSSEERLAMKQAMIDHAELRNVADHSAMCGDVDVTFVVKWHKKLHESVIETCHEENCDLIVKATKQHGLLANSIFTPSDWHILRQSSSNVMLVKDHEWPSNGRILASIGVSAKDETHMTLSESVAKSASQISELTDATLHLANSYAGAPVHIAVEVPNFSPDIYNSSVKERHIKKLNHFAKEYNVSETSIHVKEGLPEDIIPELCQHLNIDLLVIGSVGRKGVSAALLGNTAEMIIDSLDCDTLVIKE